MEATGVLVLRDAVEKAVLEIKVSLLGDASVGKTSIASSFHDRPWDTDPKSTICFELSSKLVTYANGDKVRYTIYDTAGQERFRGIMPNFVRNMDAVVVVYDITNQESFRNVNKWLHFVNNHLPYDIPVIIVGNKTDMSQYRQVSKEEGRRKADLSNSFFTETSALTGERRQQLEKRKFMNYFTEPGFHYKTWLSDYHPGLFTSRDKITRDHVVKRYKITWVDHV